MSDWDIVECGFSTADETINFGTRNFADGTNLYDICTLVTIRHSDPLQTHSRVNLRSCVRDGKVSYSVNKNIKIFTDLLCNEIYFNMSFEEVIDTFFITEDGQYLLVCLRDGTLHFIDIKNQEIIFSELIESNDQLEEKYFIECFVQEYASNCMKFLLVIGNGKVHSIAVIERIVSTPDETKFTVTKSVIHDCSHAIKHASFNSPVLLINGDVMVVYNIANNTSIVQEGLNLKRTFPYNKDMFLALDSDGELLQICNKTLITFYIGNETKFSDIIYISNPGDNYSQPFALCVTKVDEIGIVYLKSYDTYPVFSECTFTLKLLWNVHLIYPENVQDESMFVYLVEQNSTVEELRFQVVCETDPENRMKVLLRRQKFQEAERFAKLFNLDENEIKMARAQVIVDKLVCSSEDIQALMDILDGMDDVDFKLQCCFNVYSLCESLDDVAKILNYGSNVSITPANKELHELIMYMMFRFDTFMLIERLGRNEYNWADFSNCNLIELMCLFLKKGSIENAIVIYNRLDLIKTLPLGENEVETIFDLIDNLSMTVYTPFLYSFIPITLSRLPMSLPIFVRWLKEKISFIEETNYSIFPEYALEFATTIIKLMKVDKSTDVNFQQQRALNKHSIDDLLVLVKALETIKILKDAYQIYVPLKEYLKGIRSLIRAFITVDLNKEMYDHFVKNFLRPFILENRFQPDEIFLEEIDNFMQYQECRWITIVPSILTHINSVDVKLEAVITVIEAADIPWSKSVREIAMSVLEYKNCLVETVRDKIKNEPTNVILKKHSYNLQDLQIDMSRDLEFVIKRIIYCNEPTLVEDIIQLCEDRKQRHVANIMLIRHFVKRGEFEKALDILDNNTSEEITNCCEAIITIISMSIAFSQTSSMISNYSIILKPLILRWNKNNKKVGEAARCVENEFQNLQNYFKVKQDLCEGVKIEDFENPGKKAFLLDTLVMNVVQEFHDNELNISDALDRCSKISGYLNEPNEYISMKFAEKISNIDVLCEIAQCLYENEDSSRNLCLMATLLLKNIYPSDADSVELKDFGSNRSIQANDLKKYVLGLKLTWKLATKAMLKSDMHNINSCVEVCNWIYSLFYLTEDRNFDLEKKVFKNVYISEIPSSTMNTFYCVKYIFNIYTKFMVAHRNPSLQYLTHFELQVNQLSQEQFIEKIEKLPTIVQYLCNEGHNLTALKLIVTLQNGLVYMKDIGEVHKILNNILVKQCVWQLLHKVFAARHIDVELAFSLSLSLNVERLLQLILHNLKIYKRDVSKCKTIAELALKLIRYHNVHTDKQLFISIILHSKWWKKIDNCQLPMKKFFTLEKEDLLESLLCHQHLSLDMLKEFCKDFNLNLQHYYQLHLRNILVKWKPQYRLIDDVKGTKIQFENNESQLYENCKDVIELIEDKKQLFNSLNCLNNVINFYHYEVFNCIFKMLLTFNKNKDYKSKLALLTFLKSYVRVNKPGNTEIEEWYTTFPDSQSIDPLSKYRMPFTSTLLSRDIWNIIRPEINLQTYFNWFEAVPILHETLNKNDICVYVIKEVVSSGVLQKNVNSNWVMHSVHENLFQAIDLCAQNITNLEVATSAIYLLMMHTPKGADQVNASKLCLKYSEIYKETSSSSDQAMLKAFTKIQNKYFGFSANHILHVHHLDDEKYTEMTLQPHELINALYMDNRILERAHSVVPNCPDINKAVDELACLYSINIRAKRHSLLKRWLSDANTSNFDLDISMQPSYQPMGQSMENSNLNDLKRASYVCQSDDILYWQKYLVHIGLEDEDEACSVKANALKCFTMISDVFTIEELTGSSYDCFLNHIDKLFLVNDLECLGFTIDVECLNDYNKNDLLRRLVMHMNNPITVRIMGSLCITYTIYDLEFWEIIINTCVSQNLHLYLKKYLNFLQNETGYTSKKFFVNAWQIIINNSYKFSNETEKNIYDSCVENMLTIQTCPVLFSLNMEKIYHKCCQLQKYEFAAVITQYITPDEREKYIKELRLIDGIVAKIDKLASVGIWGIELVKKYLV